mmetsp:Transcript_9653/g.17361  ORF Transcript_9653/g.17361 Transcript_9653/m.17361 type:complete len:184 (-) Transcript_9653:134-685(-)
MELVSACAKGDLYKVARLMNDGEDPDAAFIGVRPLQTAIEEDHVDVIAMLLHKGASKDLVRSMKTVKVAESKNALISRLLDDEAFRNEYQPGLVERLEAAEIKAKESQAALHRQLKLVLIILLTIVICTMLALSVFVRADPDAAAKALPEKLIDHIRIVQSVVLGISKNESRAQPEVVVSQEL